MSIIYRPIIQNGEEEEMNGEEIKDLNTRCDKIDKRLEDIEENHLPHLFALIDNVKDKVTDLRWQILVAVSVIGVVLAILEVF